MASQNSDLWLWVGMVIIGYYASIVVHKQLVATRNAAEITKQEKGPAMVSQQTENALKLKTLGELARSANPDIKAASVKIIAERALQGGPAWELMLEDIAGSTIKRRDMALSCLKFLTSSAAQLLLTDPQFSHYKTTKAIINCLCNLLPEARLAENIASCHTQAQHDAVHIYFRIVASGHPPRAILVLRWLAFYPFGGELTTKSQRQNIIRDLVSPNSRDDLYGPEWRQLLIMTVQTPETRAAMIECGLWNADFEDDDFVSRSSPFSGTQRLFRIPRPGRNREESVEEQALRRRRREAMVVGEAGRPIQRSDIIELDNPRLDEEVEEALEQLIEEVTEAEASDQGWWRWFCRLRPGGLAPSH